MGFRFSKSIRLGGGIRLNLSRHGIGASFGVKGLRIGTGPRGTRLTASIPGTGISYQTSLGGGAKRPAPSRKSSRPKAPSSAARTPARVAGPRSSGATRGVPASPPPVPVPAAQPGFFAPAAEKRFYEGALAYMRGDYTAALAALEKSSAGDTSHSSDDLLAALAAVRLGSYTTAITYLERVVDSEFPLPDEWMVKYGPGGRTDINITEAVTVEAEIGSLAAALLLAESYQRVGRVDDAIAVLEELHEEAPQDAVLRLALADLYAMRGVDEGIIEVGQGVQVCDDVTFQTVLYYAGALTRRNLPQAALGLITEALKKKAKRNPVLVTSALYERGRLYEHVGQLAKARKDFERVYAADPSFADVSQRLGLGAHPTGG